MTFGTLGNGMSVWNEQYKTIAHINPERQVTFYVSDHSMDEKVEILKNAFVTEMTISATQRGSVFAKHAIRHWFKDIAGFQVYLRTTRKAPDHVAIWDTGYTMDGYDEEGEELSYGNVEKQKTLIVETGNRYGESKYDDAIVTEDVLCSYRNDIEYWG